MEITDEIVERAAKAFSNECDKLAVEDNVPQPAWDEMDDESRAHFRRAMRAALEAV